MICHMTPCTAALQELQDPLVATRLLGTAVAELAQAVDRQAWSGTTAKMLIIQPFACLPARTAVGETAQPRRHHREVSNPLFFVMGMHAV